MICIGMTINDPIKKPTKQKMAFERIYLRRAFCSDSLRDSSKCREPVKSTTVAILHQVQTKYLRDILQKVMLFDKLKAYKLFQNG